MAALEEFELGIEHIRNAFKRADNGFTNAYKMLEAQQQKNHKLEAENAKLRMYAKWLAVNLEAIGCDYYPHEHECDTEKVPMHDGCAVRDELRELGVGE